MNNSPGPLMDALAKRRVTVIGDAMLDSYLEGAASRLCQEAPVPVVTLTGRKDIPGGAANTAVNISSLGAQVCFLSAVGDDQEGNLLRQALQDRGVSTAGLVTQPGRATLAKYRLSAASQMLVRFDQGSKQPIEGPTENLLLERLQAAERNCDALVVSDYDYGVLTPRLIQSLAELQARHPRVLVVDSRRLTTYRCLHPTAVKPNYQEAMQLLGWPGQSAGLRRAESISPHGERILELTNAQLAAVTLDTEGAIFFERGRPPYRTYARPTPHSRAAGAGDTFLAALALALAAGAGAQTAAELASAAAAVAVSKEGTAACYAQELREYLSAEGKYLPDLDRLSARIEFLRQQGRRIVLTNGCFDILHRGHITYLNRAKCLGDVLVVGVNTDAGIRRLKGPDRPINSLEDRIQVLAALSCIDYLIAFDEDTPCNLVQALHPHVFVKGGDYTRERLPEAPLVESHGGTVQILPYLDDRSTTRIIERIQTAAGAANNSSPSPVASPALTATQLEAP
jgi:D-beta-D-heptose 7-phosphate kinase / D-beta-D-heptose 1-phosphate adenosyltransferase